MFPLSKSDNASGVDEYVSQLENGLRKAHGTARNTLKTTQRVMERNYDVRVLEREMQYTYWTLRLFRERVRN